MELFPLQSKKKKASFGIFSKLKKDERKKHSYFDSKGMQRWSVVCATAFGSKG